MWRTVAGVCIGLAGAGLGAHAQTYGDPQDLWTQATLYRDEWGTPHVFASNPGALAFAFGYAQAEDHLERMLHAYRVVNGRAAEIWGEAYAESDAHALKLRHGALAREAFETADPLTRELCTGFAFGVNLWMADHYEAVPEWGLGVRPEDPLALLHGYLMSFAPLDFAGAWARPPAAHTGTAFALSPSRTREGHAVLAMSADAEYAGLFHWYEAHLVTGDLNLAGATIAGLPVLLMGHNARLGWALTPNRADTADVYLEGPPQQQQGAPNQLGPVQALGLEQALAQYLLAHTQVYYVNTPGGPQPREVLALPHERGPVMGRGDAGEFAIWQAGGYDRFGAMAQLIEMGRAQDLAGFQAALALQQLPCFHVTYADTGGNIFYYYNAVAGERFDSQALPIPGGPGEPAMRDPRVWQQPLPSGTMLYEWGPAIAAARLPLIVNPASGYVQACGNPPWLATSDSPLKAEAMPYGLVRDRDTFRAQRARQLLRFMDGGLVFAGAFLYDTVAQAAVAYVPALLETAKAHEEFTAQLHPDFEEGLAVLRAWNKAADPQSEGMTFFHVWWTALRGRVGAATDDDLHAVLAANPPALWEHSLNAASDAAKLLRNEFGSVHVPWGEVHRIRRGDREAAMGGAASGEPIFTASDRAFADGAWQTQYGLAFGMAVEFGDAPSALSVVPFGASERPDSPHFADQMDLFLARQHKPTRFAEEDIIRHAESAFGSAMMLGAPGLDGRVAIRCERPVAVKLAAGVEPPGALPEGLAAFGLFVTPELGDPEVDIMLDATFRVGPELCADEALERLAVYEWDAMRGWAVVEVQQTNSSEGTFDARVFGVASLAVLGPATDRKVAATLVERHDDPAADPITGEALVVAAGEELTVGELGEYTPLDEVERPVFTPAREGQPAASRGTRVDNETFMTQRGGVMQFLAPAPERPGKPPEEAPPAPGLAAESTASAEAPESPAAPSELPEVAASPAPPSQAPESQASPLATAVLQPKEIGQAAWGKEVQLSAPGHAATFSILAKTTIQARAATLAAPPAAYPAGLVAFTEIVAMEYSPPAVGTEVALSMTVPGGVCTNEAVAQLALYGFDDEQGWRRIEGQTVSAQARNLRALPVNARCYVVLGPASAHTTAP